jgi:hypothetical protein
MTGVSKIVMLLFFALTPLFVVEVYPDVNGMAPLALWTVGWFAALALVQLLCRVGVIKNERALLFIEWLRNRNIILRVFLTLAFVLGGLAIVAREIVFAGFVYLMQPWALMVFAVISIVTGVAVLRRPAGLILSFIIFVWFCAIFSLMYVRVSSSVEKCKLLQLPPDVVPIVDIETIRSYPELDGSLPYEAMRDGDSVLITFKNLHGQGTLARFFLDGRPPAFLKTVNRRYPWMMMYPERICLDRQRKIVYSTTKTYRYFEIFRADYSGEGLTELPSILTLDRETTNCVWDEKNDRLAVLFLSPEVAFASYGFPQGVSGPAEMLGEVYRVEGDIFADYMYRDPERGQIFIATGWFPENKLTVVNEADGSIATRVFCDSWFGCFHPLGIDGDAKRKRFYLSDPINSRVMALNAESFLPQDSVKVSRFPRKITYDKSRDMVYTACYAGGTVDELSVDPLQLIRSIPLGRLVRSVAFDEQSGSTIAVSGCGVFAIGGSRAKDARVR